MSCFTTTSTSSSSSPVPCVSLNTGKVALVSVSPCCVLQSGGAVGADMHFALCARRATHLVHHFVCEKQYVYSPKDLIQLTLRDLEQADPYVLDAASIMKRSVGSNDYVRNLLRRNYFQIRDAQTVFAVATFESLSTATDIALMRRTRNVGIQGGSAWACQMFVNNFYKTKCIPSPVCGVHRTVDVPLYLFEQTLQKWFQCKLDVGPNASGFVEWNELKQTPTMPTSGVYAGIGSRQLTSAGQAAIDALYQ